MRKFKTLKRGLFLSTATLMILGSASCVLDAIFTPSSTQTLTISGNATRANAPVHVYFNSPQCTGTPDATGVTDANKHFSIPVTVPSNTMTVFAADDTAISEQPKDYCYWIGEYTSTPACSGAEFFSSSPLAASDYVGTTPL